MLIIHADRVSFAAALSGEVQPEIGSGSEPIAEAAMSSVYTTTAGNGGWSRRAGDGSSDKMAGCPGAGGRRETDAARVVLIELDTSLGLRSRPRKGWPPRPRPQPPRPPPRQGREATILLEGTGAMCVVEEVSPLVLSSDSIRTRSHIGTLQRHIKKISTAWKRFTTKFNCSVICSIYHNYTLSNIVPKLGCCQLRSNVLKVGLSLSRATPLSGKQ